jgi:hypothetical protein
MRIKGLIDEDFVNYKTPSMVIMTSFCSFKCEKDCGEPCCHNSALAKSPIQTIDDKHIIERYLSNPISKSIVFSGLEPFDQFGELVIFISMLRENYHCSDTVIIYTGYNKDEIKKEINILKPFGNIIVKFGRFVLHQEKHRDEILGVDLASPNQYAEVIG